MSNTPLSEDDGLRLALRLEARAAVLKAQEEGRLGRRLDRDRQADNDRRRHAGPKRTMPTSHQLRVIGLVSHGLKPAEAAEALCLSSWTVREHLANARRSCAAKTTAHLVGICLRAGWLT